MEDQLDQQDLLWLWPTPEPDDRDSPEVFVALGEEEENGGCLI